MKTLKRGSRGEEVKSLQRELNLLVDGIFGILTDEAVREFQKANNLCVDGIVGEQTWARLGHESMTTVLKGSRPIKELIVHCSATAEGKDFTIAQIRESHIARNFSDIGYHYVIYRDGSIHLGRDVNIAGAHCTNHNTASIGVCYIGGCDVDGKTPKDTRTPAQKKTLINLLVKLKAQHPKAKIYSHRDFANKACPSFDATREYAYIK